MNKLKYIIFIYLLLNQSIIQGQGVIFNRDFSPSEGLTIEAEKPYREEICLNGYWDIQAIPAPSGWMQGSGIIPELPPVNTGKWEETKIKIPSAINVNDWGRGANVGEGTNQPFAPSSVYFPSYPKHWIHARMGWLKKKVTIPDTWISKRIILHFEAIAGESTVFINGQEVGKNFESHLPFEIDITDYINKGKENEILIGVRHSKFFDKSHPEYAKFGATYPHGSNTDDLLGIWQDVFLFVVPAIRVADVFTKPLLDKNELEIEVQVINQTNKKGKIRLTGDIKEWINKVSLGSVLTAPEIAWELGNTALSVSSEFIEVKPNEKKTVVIKTTVDGKLKKWSPNNPNLYTLLLSINDENGVYDRKATRFGWRQFTIAGNEFHLNGEKIQCFGDIQHPFSAYICSRRFAWAWYQMIKDFGGNAVRPHAQPWPRVYYDLADEMGLMVLDETALFGSSIRLNLEEEVTWKRSREHLNRLIQRDRNHPSVIGWSAGNEMFAIALLNKPKKEVSGIWDNKLVALALSAKEQDPTRDFITLDGDRDMDGRLPVWSKHFGHGLRTEDLPKSLGKPLIVGESGATYYGKPMQLYPFVGDKAFESYYGRNEALAIDVYQNATKMARPYLAYYSPSEVSWFGVEHLNLGYTDYSRLPNLKDGIFSQRPYEEGKPGYQYERIPPYVTTFNPGLDPSLPLYKPLPMFEALKAALSAKQPLLCSWDTFAEIQPPAKLPLPEAKYKTASFIGNKTGELQAFLQKIGVQIQLQHPNEKTDILIIEADYVADLSSVTNVMKEIRKNGGLILLMFSDKEINPAINKILPYKLHLTNRYATALEPNKKNHWGKPFDLPHLYFAEIEGDRKIIKQGLLGEIVDKGEIVLTASRTDWSLFNQNPENKKCAQIVLYEHLQKPSGAALVSYPWENATLVLSVLDYRIHTKETVEFWKSLLSIMEIEHNDRKDLKQGDFDKNHDLLLDGPVN
ncbi:Beta-galactosidase [termite gut metagenome]|uniref:Beta-galactosidase n=1 Tax=termite gut metagenome TaxID=433724 RepID=A0A5J4SW12_9ZZZZ